MKKFGKLEKVDLHELWYGGAADFTPWLSEVENIVELGNAIGMELEVQEQGQKVGVFQADILCKDVLTDHFVLIGSQLERSDHTHLGQLITYAAGQQEVTIIWIARAFSEEHWTALSWLNKITEESIKFFGIEIEAYKIGDSLPAPNFKVAVKPNGWTQQVKKSASQQKLTDIELLQLEYWQGLKSFMEANNSFVKLLGTPPKSWFNIAQDRGKYFLTVTVNTRDNSLNIWLNIIGESAKEDFDRLYEIAYKDSLVEVNQNLMWYKIQAKVGCTIILKAYADFMEKNDWTNQFVWFKENLEKFDKYFRPKIKELYS
jgi:hypothetical protein